MNAPLHDRLDPSLQVSNMRKASDTPPPDATTAPAVSDIFSISDDELKERLQFIREIGYGNWGSVWACYTKDTPVKEKVAVKLVHRSKTPTTAARVRSLWNEMKICRAFKNDTHPSIVQFHSFIITPSFALISMDYLPRLIPVEVKEPKAKVWFKSLLGGVDFLHSHGVSHNDIKPANILLSREGIPVLVDFGFAEKYSDFQNSKSAFQSNLAYGTPEYLSPERARGIPHDTRKSDVYSLGITFYEILIGRTPFEEVEGEEFTTTEDLERYWARTVAGTWLGVWHMSQGAEVLLKRMTLPDANMRYTASEALEDPYWDEERRPAEVLPSVTVPQTPQHRVQQVAPSSVPSRPLPATPSYAVAETPKRPQSTVKTPISAYSKATASSATPSNKSPSIRNKQGKTKSKSKFLLASASAAVTETPVRRDIAATPSTASKPKTKAAPQVITVLADRVTKDRADASSSTTPRAKPTSMLGSAFTGHKHRAAPVNNNKENVIASPGKGRKTARKPLSASKPATTQPGATTHTANTVRGPARPGLHTQPSGDVRIKHRQSRVLVDLTGLNGRKKEDNNQKGVKPAVEVVRVAKTSAMRLKEKEMEKENVRDSSMSSDDQDPRLFLSETYPRARHESTPVSLLKQSLRSSMDKLGRMTTGMVNKQSTRPSVHEVRQSFEDADKLAANTSLPVVQVIASERVTIEDRRDRMSLWIQNVEKVVEDARSNFQKGEVVAPPVLPPLPPRLHQSPSRRALNNGVQPIVNYEPARTHRRRATVGGSTSPFAFLAQKEADEILAAASDGEGRSPSKAKRHPVTPLRGRRHITPIAKLELELDRELQAGHAPTHQRLSSIIDPIQLAAEFASQQQPREREVPTIEVSSDTSDLSTSFIEISPPVSPAFFPAAPSKSISSICLDRLYAPFTSEPSTSVPAPPPPARTTGARAVTPASDLSSKDLEGVYDRFLMATSSVVRLGRGYQSENSLNRHGVLDSRAQSPASQANSGSTITKLRRRSLFRGLSGDALGTSTSTSTNPSINKLADEFGVSKPRSTVSQAGQQPFAPDNTSVTGRVKKALQALLSTPSTLHVKSVGRLN